MPTLPRRRLSLRARAVAAILLSIVASTFSVVQAGEQPVIELWPNGAPDEKGDIGEEKDTSKPGEGLVAGGWESRPSYCEAGSTCVATVPHADLRPMQQAQVTKSREAGFRVESRLLQECRPWTWPMTR